MCRTILVIPAVLMCLAVPAGSAHAQQTPPPSPDTIDLTRRIAKRIAQSDEEMLKSKSSAAKFDDYTGTITSTGVQYDMVAIPGGKFLMGSPPEEAGRDRDEGPQVEVRVSDFYMGKYEISWDQYEPFMINAIDRYKDGSRKDYDPNVHDEVDGTSAPTAPYTEMSFGMGQRGYPAISMTHHAANKFCQWLSAQTGHFYRLPTEAEWEYAARAGTTTPYPFERSQIDSHAWYFDNGNDQYEPVGTKLANPLGLHDMHGNVMEWTADQYYPDYFERILQLSNQRPVVDPWLRPDRIYPRSVRGGSWDDEADQLRSANRRGSEKDWKMQDPQLPRSIWYHTDAMGLGFRIVRPRTAADVETMHAHWNSATGRRE